MTIQQDEHLSALVDGELDDANSEIILNKLCKDEKAKQCWHRYHLISDSLRSKLPDTIDVTFSQSVMAAIETEPTVIAPKPLKSSTSNLSKRVTGAAIAASVAVVALISFKINYQPDQEVPQLAEMPSSNEFVRLTKQPVVTQPEVPQTVASQRQPSTSAFNVSSSTSSISSTAINPSNTIAKRILKLDPKLQQYILNHNQRISGGQLQGVMPYARIVVSPTAEQVR